MSNKEYRTAKECILSIPLKKIELRETTLRNSAAGYSAVLRFFVGAGGVSYESNPELLSGGDIYAIRS
jgi:hypothetical protein